MTDTDVWWVAIATIAAGTVVIAVLLGLLIAVANRIDHHVDGTWIAARQVAGNTVSIWMLERTNEHLAEVVKEARALQSRAESIDESLRTGLASADPGD
ncbi:MAG: hypothetical protein M3P50_00040 [Actinomycetota bacterium]|nr:hypothetical protein [Actinomycetota bacterium]